MLLAFFGIVTVCLVAEAKTVKILMLNGTKYIPMGLFTCIYYKGEATERNDR